jgi:transposase InsO family protein
MRTTAVGDLTHIDLWGKYSVNSIEGNQYYILFVDDYSRYVTVQFLKTKTAATQSVRDYLTHLSTHEHTPKAIKVDRGTEFINDTLKTWCAQKGVDINMTAPYSPSQNGVAERMNRTLVELARTMLRAQRLLEFLWKLATAHAAYLQNRSYSRSVEGATPYERILGNKPNIEHLREFGSSIWILVKGPGAPRKMLPKSNERLLVGFDDGLCAVKYYNKDTRKILTSRNYKFVQNQKDLPTVKGDPHISDHEHENNTEGQTPTPNMPQIRTSRPNKRPVNKESEVLPKRTRGVKMDYK